MEQITSYLCEKGFVFSKPYDEMSFTYFFLERKEGLWKFYEIRDAIEFLSDEQFKKWESASREMMKEKIGDETIISGYEKSDFLKAPTYEHVMWVKRWLNTKEE